VLGNNRSRFKDADIEGESRGGSDRRSSCCVGRLPVPGGSSLRNRVRDVWEMLVKRWAKG
jgi:hypothetical protein